MWKNKNVWILLSGELIAGLGLWLGIIGNLEFLQDKVPSDFLKSVILTGGLLAGVAIGPLAGKVTDQLNKKTVMLVAGFVRSISVLFMLIAIETSSIWWMVTFLICTQISAAFFFPALQATIPLVVCERDLLQLNGVLMNVSTLSRIAGTGLAGLLLVTVSLSTLYIASLVAYLGLFIFTFFLKVDEGKGEKAGHEDKREKTGFKELFPILKKLPIVSITLWMVLIPLLMIGGFNLIVINISEIQQSADIKGWIYTVEGTAFMLGTFFVKKLSGKKPVFHMLFALSFLIGISELLLYFSHIPLLTLLAFVLFGFSVGCFFPIAATIFQTNVPKSYHGRFFSFRNMIERVLYQMILLLSGVFLDWLGLPIMMLIFGGMSIFFTFIFYIEYKRQPTIQQLSKEKVG